MNVLYYRSLHSPNPCLPTPATFIPVSAVGLIGSALEIPLPPCLHPFLNLRPCDPISDQPKSHTERFDILVARLVVEEEHLLECNTSLVPQFSHVRFLVPRKDLMLVKESDCGFERCRCRRPWLGRYRELLEETVCKVWSVSS